MSEFTIIERATGKVLRYGQCPPLDLYLQPQTGEDMVSGTFHFDEWYRAESGQMVRFPERPLYSSWDWDQKSWLPDLVALRAYKLKAITKQFEESRVAPVEYDGALLDADLVAQKNVSDKLVEISSREAAGTPMPDQLLVWRDADNLMHTFEDQASYKAWLQGLVVAMATRGTMAYVTSWTRKAQLEAATTYEELIVV